ncbi:hypothetical protein TorRG33x02_207800, partial [Trema orientale]
HIRCPRLPSRANPFLSNPPPNYRSSPLADFGGLAAKTTKCTLTWSVTITCPSPGVEFVT